MIEGKISVLASPIPTPIRNPRLILQATCNLSDITYRFEVHLKVKSSGSVNNTKFNQLLLQPDSGYWLCLPRNTTRLGWKITLESKHVRKWGKPFIRVYHDQCQLWFHPEHVSSKLRYLPTCTKCASLRHYLQTETKKQELVSPDRKAKHSLPSSHARIKYPTPTSKAKWLKLATQERK